MIPIKLIPAALLLTCVLPAMGEDSIPEGSDESNPIHHTVKTRDSTG